MVQHYMAHNLNFLDKGGGGKSVLYVKALFDSGSGGRPTIFIHSV